MFAVGLPDCVCVGGVGGGGCKGSHGEDPLSARNAGQVREGELGEAGGGHSGMGQVLL